MKPLAYAFAFGPVFTLSPPYCCRSGYSAALSPGLPAGGNEMFCASSWLWTMSRPKFAPNSKQTATDAEDDRQA